MTKLRNCRTLEELEFKFRLQEGLMAWPKNTNDFYNANLALAADRPDEALLLLMGHLR